MVASIVCSLLGCQHCVVNQMQGNPSLFHVRAHCICQQVRNGKHTNSNGAMLATNKAGYSTEVQLELVVVALAWGEGLMNTCWIGTHMQRTGRAKVH